MTGISSPKDNWDVSSYTRYIHQFCLGIYIYIIHIWVHIYMHIYYTYMGTHTYIIQYRYHIGCIRWIVIIHSHLQRFSAHNSAELLRETLFLGCAQALRRMLLGLLITGKIEIWMSWSYHWETFPNCPMVQGWMMMMMMTTMTVTTQDSLFFCSCSLHLALSLT